MLCSARPRPSVAARRSWRRCGILRPVLSPSIVRERLVCHSGEGEKERSGGDMEALFQQELERRKAASTQPRSSSGGGGSSPFSAPPPPPSFAREPETPPQLQKSRELNSEGLEGLVPRASELIKLGLAFSASFGPFIVGVALAFWALYSVFGSAFVHGGQPGSGPPPYVDPDLLLAQPTLDPTVPFNAYPDSFN